MSKVKITGHASGSGTLTLSAPNTSSDRTITLPDETGTVALGVGIDDNADATAITIGADENIGIGVTPESHYTGYVGLDVGNNAALISNNTGTNVTALLHNSYLNSGATAWLYKNTDEASMYNQVDGKHQFKTAASGSADAAITWTTPLEIHSDGRGLSQFTAKVWCHWGSSTIVDSHNVSGVDNDATGLDTVNFTNALSNANYSCATSGAGRETGDTDHLWRGLMEKTGRGGRTTSQITFGCAYSDSTLQDTIAASMVIFGD
jgi:hypothetical protein